MSIALALWLMYECIVQSQCQWHNKRQRWQLSCDVSCDWRRRSSCALQSHVWAWSVWFFFNWGLELHKSPPDNVKARWFSSFAQTSVLFCCSKNKYSSFDCKESGVVYTSEIIWRWGREVYLQSQRVQTVVNIIRSENNCAWIYNHGLKCGKQQRTVGEEFWLDGSVLVGKHQIKLWFVLLCFFL
jgi:hypothetical protein